MKVDEVEAVSIKRVSLLMSNQPSVLPQVVQVVAVTIVKSWYVSKATLVA